MEVPESIKEAVNRRVCELSGKGEGIDFYVLNKVEEYAEKLLQDPTMDDSYIPQLISQFDPK